MKRRYLNIKELTTIYILTDNMNPEFPIFNTKELTKNPNFEHDLNTPSGRRLYFGEKLGDKIEHMKEYLDTNAFIGFMVSKKMAGKSTYSKMFGEIVEQDRFKHISVGDLVRDFTQTMKHSEKRDEFEKYLEENYRGMVSLDEAIDAVVNHTQDKLIPTEIILALVKKEIEMTGRKGIFIDGLPRNMDQISYSLFYRDIINFREFPDFFVLIDTPESLIEVRIEGRVVCPVCHISRNLRTNPTGKYDCDEESSEYYLICDNPGCAKYGKQRLIRKAGDEEGLDLIRGRLNSDAKLLEKADKLVGIPKVYLRNTVPVSAADENIDDYEITPAFSYRGGKGEVKMVRGPLVVTEDSGEESYSRMPAATTVSLFSQIYDILFPGE